MALTQLRSRCLNRTSHPAKVLPLAKQLPLLVPEATVKEMLRDIAFVLKVTSRLSEVIRKSKTCGEADRG
jgi:hypothetical protein